MSEHLCRVYVGSKLTTLLLDKNVTQNDFLHLLTRIRPALLFYCEKALILDVKYPGCVNNVIDLPHLFTVETALHSVGHSSDILFCLMDQMETGTLHEFMYSLDQFTIEFLLQITTAI